MKAAGVTRLGRRQVWLLALGGMVYFAVASLYSLYGQVSFDFSSLIRLPESRTALTTQFVVAMGEEVLFRGLVLCALYSAWGSTRKGTIGSVVVTSLLFAALHLTQVFTHGVSTPIGAATDPGNLCRRGLVGRAGCRGWEYLAGGDAPLHVQYDCGRAGTRGSDG